MAGLVLLATLAGPAAGQWLEETILLPDSLGGLLWPTCVVVDTVRDQVYVAGGDEDDLDGAGQDAELEYWLAVVDAVTCEKVSRIRMPDYTLEFCLNEVTGRLLCRHKAIGGRVTVVDCDSRSVVTTLSTNGFVSALGCNPQADKFYVSSSESLHVYDGLTLELLSTLALPIRPRGMVYCEALDKLYCWSVNDSQVAVVDGTADTLTALLLYGRYVWDVAVDPEGGKVFVLYESSPGQLAVVDGITDSTLAVVVLGYGMQDICWNSLNRRLYCASVVDSIWVVDGVGDSVVTRIGTPYLSAPLHIWCAPEHGRLYALGLDYISERRREVTVLDTQGDSLLPDIIGGVHPLEMAYDPERGRMFSVNNYTEDLSVIDCAGDSVLATVGLGFLPSVLCYVEPENKVYCASEKSDRVIVLDGATNRIIARVPVSYYVTDICYNPVLNKVYVASIVEDRVSAIDCASDSVVASIPDLAVYRMCCSPTGPSKLYCTVAGDDRLAVVDCRGDSVLARVRVGPEATAIRYNPVDDKVYCSVTDDPMSLAVVDCGRDSVLGYPCLGALHEMAHDPVNDKVYAGLPLLGTRILDAAADTVIAVVDTGREDAVWWSSCVNTRDQKVYISSAHCDVNYLVLVLDARADTVVTVLVSPAGGRDLRALCYNPINNKVYVACAGTNNVAILDGASDEVLGSVPVRSGPEALAWNPASNRMYVADKYGSSISVLRDSIVPGVAESPPVAVTLKPLPTILRNVLNLQSPIANPQSPVALLDISGRKVMDLHPGDNDISHLSPGVYFIRAEGSRGRGSEGQSRKVVIQR